MVAEGGQCTRVAGGMVSRAYLAAMIREVHMERVPVARSDQRFQKCLGPLRSALTVEQAEATADAKDMEIHWEGRSPQSMQ